MYITVFGGSHAQPGTPGYAEAQHLGELLGRAGHTVLTGGYMGAMEAVSRGAAEAGGHVIGVTCQEIEDWRRTGPNPWVQEEMRLPTFRDRLHALIDHCQAALALPGGVGTLVEISLTWNEMIIHTIPAKPLILVGSGWRTTFQQFFDSLGSYILIDQRSYVSFAPTVEEAVASLDHQVIPPKGPENINK